MSFEEKKEKTALKPLLPFRPFWVKPKATVEKVEKTPEPEKVEEPSTPTTKAEPVIRGFPQGSPRARTKGVEGFIEK